MYRDEELRLVVEDLVRVMHDQTRGLETLVEHLGQVVGRLPDGSDLSVVRSELAALHARAKRLVAAARQKV
jgi:hypothetical protein